VNGEHAAGGHQDGFSGAGQVGPRASFLEKIRGRSGGTGGSSGRSQGKFIVLEGGEGVGKSTQMQCLAKYLQGQDIPHILTREPGGTVLAERLRAMIVQEDLSSMEELLLIIAARLHHGRNVIQPALDAGMWVLCDRFMASSLVYQGIVGGVGMELVEQLHGQAGCTLVPDKTFIIMLDPEIAMRRRQANRASCNKFDQKSIDFHKKIHQAYRVVAERYSHTHHLIQADDKLDTVTERILKYIQGMI
jgi:dTMP kinase